MVMQAGYEIRRPWLTKYEKLAYLMEMMFKTVHSKNEENSLCCFGRINSSSLLAVLIFHTLISIRKKSKNNIKACVDIVIL